MAKVKPVEPKVNPDVPVEPEGVEPQEITEAAKHFLQSKVLWVNILAFLAFFIQTQFGFVISEELQLQLLSLINIGLRFVTKEKLVW